MQIQITAVLAVVRCDNNNEARSLSDQCPSSGRRISQSLWQAARDLVFRAARPDQVLRNYV